MAEEDAVGTKIDWRAVRKRLSVAIQNTEAVLEPSRRSAERVLQERARALSAAKRTSDAEGKGEEVVPFGLGNSTWLIHSRFALEALQTRLVVPVPRTPAFVRGITSIRGELLPVFDLASFLGQAGEAAPDRQALLVLGRGQPEFSIAVDWVRPVQVLAREAILNEPHENFKGAQLLGVTRDGRFFLDGEELLTEPSFFLGATIQDRSWKTI